MVDTWKLSLIAREPRATKSKLHHDVIFKIPYFISSPPPMKNSSKLIVNRF